MNFLLDTNVISEWVKPRPDPGVVAWTAWVDEDRTHLSVVTLAELRRGVVRLEEGARRRRLDEWLRGELPLRFEGRILVIDARVADDWGEVVAARERAGRPIGMTDAFMAATARVHDLTLVTRNTVDFEPSVESILNPFRT